MYALPIETDLLPYTRLIKSRSRLFTSHKHQNFKAPVNQRILLFELFTTHGRTPNTPGLFGAVLIPRVANNLPLLSWFWCTARISISGRKKTFVTGHFVHLNGKPWTCNVNISSGHNPGTSGRKGASRDDNCQIQSDRFLGAKGRDGDKSSHRRRQSLGWYWN